MTVALALGVAAVVILPTLYGIADSQRQVFRYEDIHESIRLTWLDLRYLLRPPPLPVTRETMHHMAFSGTATLLLAAVGALLPGAGAWFGRVLGIVVVLVVLDLGLLRVLYWILPEFSVFRPLGRLLFFINFAVALLAGLGLDHLWRWAKDPRMSAMLRRWPSLEALAQRSRSQILAGMAVAAATVCVVTSLELISYARGVNPPFHARLEQNLYPVTPLIAAINGAAQTSAVPERLLPIVPGSADVWYPPTLFAAEPLVLGIEALTGYDSVVPRRALQVLRVIQGEPVAHVLASPYSGTYASLWAFVSQTRYELLGRVGVTLVAGSPDIDLDPHWCPAACAHLEPLYAGVDGKVFRVRGATAGPWLSYLFRGVETDSQALRALADPAVDARRSVILQKEQMPLDYPRTSLTAAGTIASRACSAMVLN